MALEETERADDVVEFLLKWGFTVFVAGAVIKILMSLVA